MKPKTKRESMWRFAGWEYRKLHKMGTGKSKIMRRHTRMGCNRAMRDAGKQEIREQMEEL